MYDENIKDLMKNPNYLNNIIKSIPDCLIILNPDGTIKSVNEPTLKLLGYSNSQITGKSIGTILAKEEEEEKEEKELFIHTKLKKLIKKGSVRNLDIHFITKSNEKIPMNFNGSVIRDDKENIIHIIGIARDMREQKKALQESEKKFRSLFQNANASIYLHEVSEDNIPGRIIEVNDAACRTMGYSREELISMTPLDFTSKERLDKIPEIMENLLTKGRFTFEGQNVTKTGHIIPVEISAHIFTFKETKVALSIVRDITERKKTEEALRNSEKKYRTLVETTQEGIGIADPDENIIFANESFANFLGYKKEKFIGINLKDISDKEEFAKYREETKKRQKGQSSIYETKLRTKSGTSKYFSVSASPLYKDDGTFLGTLGLLTDITKRKEAEESLLKRDTILEAIAFVSKQFLATSNWKHNIQDALAQLGKATKVSRVYIFDNHLDKNGTLSSSQRYEWVAEKITPQIGNPDLHDVSWEASGMGRWISIMSQGDVICGHVKNFPDSEQEILGAQDIISILAVPIFVNQKWWGFIGFDECKNEHEWPNAEIEVLKTAADIIGEAIHRSQIEKLLRESENRYRLLADNVNDVIWTIDFNLKFTYISPSVEHLVGYSAKEIMSLNIKDLVTPSSYKLAMSILRDRLSKKPKIKNDQRMKPLEFELVHKDGSTVWIEVLTSLIYDNNGKPSTFISIGRDIAERKKVEKALQESERKFRELAENMNELVYVINPKTHGTTYVNRAIVKTFGYSQKKWLSDPSLWEKSLHPEDKARFFAKRKEASTKEEDMISEYRIVDKNKQIKWLEDRIKWVKDKEGKIIGLHGIALDISERKKAEEMLQESEEKYRTLAESSADVIFLNNYNGQYLYANPTCAKYLGVKQADVIGSNLSDLHPKQIARERLEDVRRVFHEGKVVQVDCPMQLEKELRYFSAKLAPITSSKGDVISVVGIARDITERKKLAEQIINIERLAAAAQLSSGISHEFNNILAIIKAGTEWANKNINNKKITKKTFKTILDECDHARDLVTQLNKFVRKKPFRLRDVNIVNLTKDILSLQEVEFERKHIKIIPDYTTTSKICGDKDQLTQVLLNIILNARDAMEDNKKKKKKLWVKTYEDNKNVYIKISDAGCGIEKENLKKVFEPFYTTKGALGSGKIQGTGLGLAVSHGIIQNHNGQIDVESKVGAGSSFTVLLPKPMKVTRKVRLQRRKRPNNLTWKTLAI